MNEQSFTAFKKKDKKSLISASNEQLMMSTNENFLFRKIYIKFIVMRVRAKISYMAMIRRMTVVELFVTAIQKSYKDFLEMGLIKGQTIE